MARARKTDTVKPTFFADPQAFRRVVAEAPSQSTSSSSASTSGTPASRASPGRSPSIRHCVLVRSTDQAPGRRRGLHDSVHAAPAPECLELRQHQAGGRAREVGADAVRRPTPAFAKRDEEKSRIYSYEQRVRAKLEPHHRRALEVNSRAWAFFQAQPPWLQRRVTYWIVSAKTEETRLRRLQKLINDAARGRRL